jgi:type VI secretion system secreted protein VgrG
VLLLQGLAGTEELGRPFRYELELLSETLDVAFDQILGQNVTVGYDLPDGSTRYINGFVSRFVQTSAEGRTAKYAATVVPWLWFLTRTADCRVYQNQTVPDIVKSVCADRGFTDLDQNLSGTYLPWEYCVQYRETDFNFVSRLLEHEGIYYYFRHEEGKHTLVLCDGPAAHQPAPGAATVAFHPPSDDAGAGFITSWSVARQVESGTVALNDYDFTKPLASLQTKSQVSRGDAYPAAEVYDYPGAYTATSAGEETAKVRIQELQAQYELASAETDLPPLATGYTFTMTDHPRDDQNRAYLITAATCQITGDDFDAGTPGGEGAGANSYACQFTAIDAQTPFRPARLTRKPTVAGPQTAVVVGPAGDEIYTDPNGNGQVKVQFFWDRYGADNQDSSCWIRVSQLWAGKGWGAMFIPRIGQEVIVDFLEGDPDRPIVTGRVYNGVERPPYPLPDNKTMSTIKSNSSPGGAGFNELRFEDKKGAEQIFIHGQRNQDVRILNDSFEWVGNDRHLVVKNSQFEHVDTDLSTTVDRDHMEEVGRDRHTTIEGKEARSVAQTLSLKVTGNVGEEFGASHSEQVTNDYYLKADNIVIEGMTSITIKVGSNYIAIDSSGIKIGSTGTLDTESTGATTVKSTAPLSIQSQATGELKVTGPLSIESQAQAELKGPMVSVEADAMLTLKGGITMIN